MRRRLDKPLDKTMERLIKETADELGIPTGVGREAYLITMELGFRQVRKFVPLLLPNMGLFYFSAWKVAKRFKKMFESMRAREKGEHPEGMTREEVAQVIKETYWDLKVKAMNHYPRTGRKYKIEQRKKLINAGAGIHDERNGDTGAAQRNEKAQE